MDNLILRILSVGKPSILLVLLFIACTFKTHYLLASSNAPSLPQTSYQSDLYFDQLTLETGLNQGSIFAIATDHRGFTWIGTQDGLHLFDGNTTQLIQLSDTNIPKYRYIRALKVVNKQLIIATHDGLVSLNLDTGKKQYFNSNVGEIYHIEQVDNQIWLAGDIGIAILDPTFKTIFTLNAKKDICAKNFQENNNCHGITRSIAYHSKTNSVWLGTSVGLFSYNRKSHKLKKHTVLIDISPHKNLEVRALVFDKNDTLWIGSHCGLYKKPITTNKLIPVESCKETHNFLNSTNVRALAIDNSNNLWIGSSKGVSWFSLNNNKINSQKIKQNTLNKHGLTNEFIRSIHTDNKGRIWVGTNNGVSITNIDRLKVKSYRAPNDSIIGNYTYSFMMSKNNHLLYISNSKGLNLVPTNNTDNVIPIIKDDTIFDTESNGKYTWAGGRGYLYQIDQTTNKIISTYDASNSPLDGRYIYKLLSVNNTNLWVGSSYGLYHFNTKNNTWTYWNKHNGLIDGEIYELNWINNKLWIGTQNGISVFDVKNNSFVNYNHKNSALTSRWVFDINTLNNKIYVATDGGVYEFINNTFKYLPIINGNAYSVLPFSNNKLLVTTNTGLKLYDIVNKITLTLTTENGLASDEFNYNAHYINKNNIYLGNPTGYTVIAIDHIENLFTQQKINTELTEAKYITQATLNENTYNMWAITPMSDNNLLSTHSLLINWFDKQASLQLSNPYFATKHNSKFLSSYLSLTSEIESFSLAPKHISLSTLHPDHYSLKLHQKTAISIIKSPHPLLSKWATFIYIVTFIFITLFILRFYYLTKFTKKLKNKNMLITQQHKEIDEHLKFKEHIYYQVQHTLKSPISASRGLLHLLEQQLINNKFDKQSLLRKTHKIQNAQSYLAELIDQIIIISKSDNSSQTKSIQHIKNVFDSVLPIMNDLADQKNITLEVENINVNNSARVSSIEMGVFIMFENIISNAIKYSPKYSTVNIIVEQKNNQLYITITDKGSGIIHTELDSIFNMFYRGTNSIGTTGSGLGLSLVKNIIDDNNGSITIDSQIDMGTTVNIILKLIK